MKVNLSEYEPLGNNVLLKMNSKTKTDSGLFLPKAVNERWMEVVKKGPMVELLEIGDVALVGESSAPMKLTFGDVNYLQIAEFAIVGRIPAEVNEEVSNATFT